MIKEIWEKETWTEALVTLFVCCAVMAPGALFFIFMVIFAPEILEEWVISFW